MSRIVAAAPALPGFVSSQEEIADVLAPVVSDDPTKQALLRRLHGNSGVRTRHHIMPIAEYARPMSVGATNDRWTVEATRLSERAARDALARAGIRPEEVDTLVFTSVTGIAAPSVDALLVPLLGLREDVKRVPMYGLGCVAGAAGLARVHELLAADPGGVALLVAVELCSLTVQHGDDSMDNLVASGLFGDGAAAVVMVGDEHAADGPRVVATRSRLYPDTHDAIGFRLSDTGFRVVLTADVVPAIDAGLAGDVDTVLDEAGLAPEGVGTWVAHPGGPRVLDAIERNLHLGPDALRRSRESLAAVGNLSSASVLQVLAEELEAPHAPGDHGMVVAFGPGISAELVLLEW